MRKRGEEISQPVVIEVAFEFLRECSNNTTNQGKIIKEQQREVGFNFCSA